MKFLRIALIAILFLTACGEGPKEAAQDTPETQSAPEAEFSQRERLLSNAGLNFLVEGETADFLNAGPATNVFGHENGYFTNQAGVTGYFWGYDMPFNFTWSGGTKRVTAMDGQTYQVMDGPGMFMLKYLHDDLLLQTYQGDMAEGLWQGYGTSWVRNANGEYNSYTYQGEFKNDRMDGRGVLRDYDSDLREENPYEYRGGFKDGQYHGFGTETDMVTGQVLIRGLWFNGQGDEGITKSGWQKAEAEAELNQPGRQFTNLMRFGPINWGAFINDTPGEGPLTIILPEDAKNAKIVDEKGREFTAEIIRHPAQKKDDGSDMYVTGMTKDFSPAEYPLTFTVTFHRAGDEKAGARFTVKRPFIMELL